MTPQAGPLWQQVLAEVSAGFEATALGSLGRLGYGSAWRSLCGDSGLCLPAEICAGGSGASGGEEAGAGLPAVPPEREQRGLQCHRLPALLLLPGVPAKVAVTVDSGLSLS